MTTGTRSTAWCGGCGGPFSDLTVKKATSVTCEAHSRGRAVTKTCHKELAELYEERLRAKGLIVSTEPAR